MGEAGITEERATFVSAIGGGDVATAGIGRKEKNIAVTPGCENYGIARESIDFAGAKVAGDDSLGVTINQNKVEHLGLRKHFYGAERNLAAQRLISAEQKLLAGLATRVEGP